MYIYIYFHCLKYFDVNSGMRISDTHDVRVIKINHLKGLNAPIVVVVFCLSKKNQKKNLICIKIKELLT